MARLIWIDDDAEGAGSQELGLLGAASGIYSPTPEDPAIQALGVRVRKLESRPQPDAVVLFAGRGPKPLPPLEQLVDVVDRLLGPGGCPWDQEQTHESLKKHLVEETYEVLDAIDSGDPKKLCEELGDLLLQPIMHAQMERAAGGFSTEDVANAIVEKLVRRHPHVFGGVDAPDADSVLKNWDAIKKRERAEPRSVLEGVPRAMPSLLRALEISKRAARSGFEWPDIEAVFDKLREEESELREAVESGDAEGLKAEIGDLLFTAVNLARWAKVDPEEALRSMLDRFSERFQGMEHRSSKPLTELSPDEWDALWEEQKRSQGVRSSDKLQ